MDDAELEAAFRFPSEFPYEFDSVGNDSSDEDDFLATLTHRLTRTSLHQANNHQQKPLLTVPICNSGHRTEGQKMATCLAGSPQSTLSRIGSWSCRSGGSGERSPNGSSHVPSPTAVPLKGTNNDAWDVLYAAAGQVARLKTAENAFFANHGVSQLRYQVGHGEALKRQCGSVWGSQAKAGWVTQQNQPQVQNRMREFGCDYEAVKCTRSLPHPAWHPLQVKPHNNQQVPRFGSGSRPVLQARSSANKRGCAGTGVFLPRQYSAPPESRKKTGCASPILVPAKVIHALSMNIDDFNAASQPRFSSAFGVDYDALLARRNALLLQQKLSMRREEAANHELRLPQEWTY